MENKPLISIIVPVYNVEKHLNNCIDSIINQTYKNIEIILVDDGSKDNSSKICDNYINTDNRVKVFHKTNGGLSSTRNCGITNSTGEYITFIDSDDDIETYYVEYLYELIKKYKTKMSIAAYTIVSKNRTNNIGNGYKEELLNTEAALSRLLCEDGFTVSACAKLYKKSLFNNIKFPEGKLCEDNGTTYKLIMKCKKIAYGNKSIYNYYKRENSIMTSNFNLKKLDLIELTDTMCKDIITKYPNLINETNKRIFNSRFSILRQMIYIDDKNNLKIKKVKIKIIKFLLKNKKIILSNKKSSIKDKIAILSLSINYNFFALIWKMYKKIGD